MDSTLKYYTTKDIIGKHQFTSDFINKCLKRLNPIFKGHIKRGENNARLFDSEAMNIFDIISQKKQNGQSITEIETIFLEGYKPSEPYQNNSIERITTSTTAITAQAEIIRLMEKHQRELKDEMEKRIMMQAQKDETIRYLEKEKAALGGAVKLLTDGKDPKQVREEWEEDQRRLIRIDEKYKAIKALSVTQWWRRRKLLQELGELLGHSKN